MKNATVYKKLGAVIGNTPLYRIDFTYQGVPGHLFAKAEQFNLTGSIKDRMAYHILKKGFCDGRIHEGMRIAEATSGNTGISFAAVGAAMGLHVSIFMPDWMSEERKALIRSFGADIHLVSREAGGFLGSIAQADALGAQEGVFLPHQFANRDNPEAHALTTGPEIIEQLQCLGLRADAFVAGVGTGGTIMGVGQALRAVWPKVRIHPLEPQNSPTLKRGHKVGTHRIQGISDDFIPEIVRLDQLASIVDADDGDAILMAQKLARTGIGVGISSGANFIGAVKILAARNFEGTVVTVFADDNKKYLSTDLMRDEPVKEHFLSKDIEITGVTVVERPHRANPLERPCGDLES